MPSVRVDQVTKTGRNIRQISACEDATQWTEGATGTDNLDRTTANLEGRFALTFDKVTGGTEAFVTLDLSQRMTLGERAGEMELAARVYLSDLTDVANVHLRIGKSASHYAEYTFSDTALAAISTAWKHLSADIMAPTSETGEGLDTNEISWVQVAVEFDNASDTLADIRLDDVRFQESGSTTATVTGTVTVTGTTDVDPVANSIGLATGAKQDTGNTSLASILAKIIAAPATEAKQDTGIGHLSTIAGKDFATETTLAAISAAVATAANQTTGNASLATIAGDTTSMDGKMPADPAREGGNLATAVTHLSTIAGDTTSIDSKVSTAANQATANGHLSTLAGAVSSAKVQSEICFSSGKWDRVGSPSSGPPVCLVNSSGAYTADVDSSSNLKVKDDQLGGMATSLSDINSDTSSIDAKVSTAANQATANGLLATIDSDTSDLASTVGTYAGGFANKLLVVGGHDSGTLRALELDSNRYLHVTVKDAPYFNAWEGAARPAFAVHDNALGASTGLHVLGSRYESSLSKVSTDGDWTRQKATIEGIPLTRPEHPTSTTHGETFAAAQTDYSPANGKWDAPGAGKRLVIVGYDFSAAAAQGFSLQDEDDNELIGKVWLPATGNKGKEKCYIPLPTNKALELTTDNAVNHSATVSVITEQV